MKLKFSIHYQTQWGESLAVVITYHTQDGHTRLYNLPMQTTDGDYWICETAVMESRQWKTGYFTYYYQVEDEKRCVIRKEWSLVHRQYSFEHTKSYIFPDTWRDAPLHSHLYTRAWETANGIKHAEAEDFKSMPLFRKTLMLRVSAPQLHEGEMLAVCGDHPSLGAWNPVRYLPMIPVENHDWIITLNMEGMRLPIEYKYVVVDSTTKTLRQWEEGDNRTTGEMTVGDGEVLVLHGGSLHLREDLWKIAGVCVPLFSLRSEHSYGMGDFGDLKRMVDWAEQTGMKVIQLLPLNDTTSTHSWTDSHPYNAISAFALHPLYLNLEKLGTLKDKQKMMAYQRQQRELNALGDVDYPSVERVKTAYVNDIFEQEGERVLRSSECRAFVEKYRWWLEPYAAFTLLRDRYQTARFSDWKEDSEYNEKKIHQLCSQSIDIQRVYYVQFNLWKQLCEAAEYARSKQVILKGDMAIGMYRDSVETWTHPGIFHMDSQMGTPPDNQQPLGQNWGFPTYNWEQNDGIHEKAENIYDWIKKRLQWMEQFFDAIRMDHIVGYFRTWEIPSHCLFSTMGHYAPALPLTPDEIGQFGLQFRKELMTRPFISDRIIEKVFGIHAHYVREHFLSKKAYGLYDILPQFDTQVKVRDFFAGKDDENSLWIRDGLYRILQNVLFVEDVREPQMYHPRFAVFNEPVYEVLDAEEKDAFMRIYNNYYFERHNSFWQGKASQRLSQILEDTHLLVCAEDLGLLPACVEPVLDNLRILTLEVQDLPKQYGIEFAHIDSYPFRSVATFATHDMSPMRLWWEESAGRTQRYFTTMLQKQGRAPEKLTTVLAEEIIGRHLYGPSMLCVLLLQDWLSMDGMLRRKNVREERINIPNDSYNHWCYRMHVTIEQLIASTTFNRKLKTMIERSKRYK